MKCEWKEVVLADVLKDKGYIRGPFGSALKRNEMLTSGIPVYEQQHAIYNSRDFRFFISNEKFEMMKRFQVKTNDILISCSGTVGKVTIINEEDPKGIISQALLLLRVNDNVILPNYLKYFFSGKKGYNSIISRSSGSVQVNISKREVIEQIPISLPPLLIQKKIVSILSKIDYKIELNNKINKNLEEQAQALFKSWFVDTENKNRILCTADEYFDISIGKTPPRKEMECFSTSSQDVRWVSISDMGSCGMYISRTSERLTEDAIKKYNVKIVPDNTVLLSFKLTVGRIAITNGEMTTNEAIAHFKTENKNVNEYLYCYLKNFNYQTMGSTSSIATAVNSKIIKKMPFIVPTDTELSNFHRIVSPMFATIKAKQLENENLINLRDTLLPKLMSGEIDVSGVEI